MYVQVTRGAAPREFPFPARRIPRCWPTCERAIFPQPGFQILAGISLHPVEDLRWGRCDIKSTNLLAAVLAKQEAREAGAWEALFVAPDGVIREGAVLECLRGDGRGAAHPSSGPAYPRRNHTHAGPRDCPSARHSPWRNGPSRLTKSSEAPATASSSPLPPPRISFPLSR